MRGLLGATAVAVALLALAAGAREGEEQVGQPARPWEKVTWVQGDPVPPPDQAKKVLLVRWWTDGCSLCASTAPALNEFHQRYAKRGLVVVGMYHAKPPGPRPPADVRTFARQLGFKFPVAIDEDWSTLRRWWLDGADRSFTSVTFLIDRRGRIRYIHPGGEFYASGQGDAPDRDYRAMKAAIERVLGE